jgi:hypothetical protein
MEIFQKLLVSILDILVLIVLAYMVFYIIIKVKAERHQTKATFRKIPKVEKNSSSQLKTIYTSDRQSVEVPNISPQSAISSLQPSISLPVKSFVESNSPFTPTINIPQLLENKTNSDSQIRQSLAIALGKSLEGKNIRKEMQAAIATLGELSSDRDPSVRQAAVVALGEIGTQKALPFLKKALRDFDSDVVKSASEAMEKFKRYRVSSKATQPPLKKKIKSTQS